MANKDFAKTQSPGGETGTMYIWRNGLLLLAAILLLGISFIAGLQSGSGQDKTHVNAEENTHLQTQIKKQQQELEALKNKILKKEQTVKHKPDVTDEVGTLTFYEALPNQSVTPAPMHTSPQAVYAAVKPIHTYTAKKTHGQRKKTAHITKAKAKTHQKKGVYRVQLGAYHEYNEAVRFRTRLKSKTGLHSYVRTSSKAEKSKWYRVSVGPFSSRTSAEKTIQMIQKKMHTRGFILSER